MIQDLLMIFKSAYNEYGDKIILDNYTLKDGLYIRINENGENEYLKIKATKNKDGTIDYIPIDDMKESTLELYKWFKIRDYYSSLVDMNKPIDPKKKIHSNNYLSMFIKKDVLIGEKALSRDALVDRIQQYYDILKNPEIKYKDKKGKELLGTVKPDVDEEDLILKRDYILKNLDDIIGKVESMEDEFDGYVKIFFMDNEDLKKYELEYTRYILPNIFNKNNYNVLLNDKIFGLSNNNMGMNSKKPYLEQKTTKFKVPYRINSVDAMLLNKFFDWLNYQLQGEVYIPIDFDFKKSISNHKNSDIGDCHYLYITKGKEVIIEDYEFLPRFSERIEFTLENFLDIEKDEGGIKYRIEDKEIDQLWKLENEVDNLFFNKRLKNGYFMDPKPREDFSKNMLNILIINKQAFYNYFKKGTDLQLKSIIDDVSLEIVKEHISKGNRFKSAWAYNLRISFLKYFELEGMNMGGKIRKTLEELNIMINTDDVYDLNTDEQFYFLSGQLAYFILSKSKATKKNHDLIESFLRARSGDEIKEQLQYSYDRYKHAISLRDSKFNKAFSMVLGYDTKDNKKLEDVFLSGFLSKNIFYTSSKEKGDIKNEDGK